MGVGVGVGGICSKTQRRPFPYPTDDTYKIWSRLANWSRRIHNKSTERARNSKVTDPIRPEFELGRDFMPLLFDEYPNKNEQASLETTVSHYKSMGNFLDTQGHLTPYEVVRPGRNSISCEN